MRPQIFKTRITELLNIPHPILCGGLGPGVSDAKYVSAVVKAGGMGFIVSSSPLGPDWFEQQLMDCSSQLGRGFGVNLYISRLADGTERALKLIPLLADYGVTCVETAGSSPEPLIPLLREAGIAIIHKVPAVKYAKSVARLPVDAVTVAGADCGGHPGTLLIGTMVQAAHAAQELSKPIVVGGGIGTGSQLAAALTMGADAIVMGTRMMVAEELWIHPAHKERMVSADGTESVVVKSILRDQHRVLNNRSAQAVLDLEKHNVTEFDAYRAHVMGQLAHDSYRSGSHETGMLDYGPSAVFANEVKSVEAIFDQMLDEALLATSRISGLMLR